MIFELFLPVTYAYFVRSIALLLVVIVSMRNRWPGLLTDALILCVQSGDEATPL